MLSGRGRVARFFAIRIAVVPLSMLLIASVSFAIVNVLPGDPALQIAGDFATPEELERITEELGRSGPLADRYLAYLGSLTEGDLGRSYFSSEPIKDIIVRLLPNTMELMVLSLSIAVTVGLVLGGVMAYFEGKPLDRMGRGVVTFLQSVPDFILGLVLIYVLFAVLEWAPSPTGRLSLLERFPARVTGFLIVDSILARDWALLGSALKHAALPAMTLGLAYSTYIAKTTRNALSGALDSAQVEFARAIGLSEWTVFGYAFRASRTPILTYGAIVLGAMAGGAAIVESIFSWPGLGSWALDSMFTLDLPAIQGFILLTGTLTLFVYIVLDFIVMLTDPRVTYG